MALCRTTLAPLIAVGLVATSAEAADHTVELQLPAESVLNLIRARAQAEAPCPMDFDFAGSTVLLDHLEFPSASDDGESLPRMILDGPEEDIAVSADSVVVVGHRTKAVLPMVFVIKSPGCALDPNGCSGARVEADLFIDLSVRHDGDLALCLVGDRLEPDLGIPGPDIVPETCVALPTDYGLDRLHLALRRAALSTDGNRLGIRFTFVDEDIVHTSVGEYESFLAGNLGPGGDQPGTSLFIAQNLFSTAFREEVYAQLSAGEIADFTYFSEPLESHFHKMTPAITVEGTLSTNPCYADLEFLGTTTFSYIPDGQGGHWLKSDVTDTESFDYASFTACLTAMVLAVDLTPVTATVLSSALNSFLSGKLAGNGVGSQTPVYPMDPLWNFVTREHSKGSDGKTCEDDADCHGGTCLPGFNFCVDPRCSNGVKDGEETSVDCGGPSCEWCDGQSLDQLFCGKHSDCSTNSCIDFGGNKVCAAPACPDGRWNGFESDVDCGAGTCQLCAYNQDCNSHDDCAGGMVCKGFCEVESCTDRVCVAPTCDNGVKDGHETWVDCGGDECGACPAARRVNTHHIAFYNAINLPSLTLGGVSAQPELDHLVTGQADGLLLSGSFAVPPPPEPEAVNVSIYPIVRQMGFSGTCYTGGFVDQGYEGGFQVKGTPGARLCEAPEILNDTLHKFSMSTPSDLFLPAGYDLELTVAHMNIGDPNQDSDGDGIPDVDENIYSMPIPDPYWSSPYDPIIHLESTAGALTFAVPAPDVPTTWDEMFLAQIEAVGTKAALCHVPGSHYWPGGYNPLWDVDPEYNLVIHLKDTRGRISQVSARVTNIQIVAEAYAVLNQSAYVAGAPLYFVGDVTVSTRNGPFSTRLIFNTRADVRLNQLQTVTMTLARPVTMVHSLGALARGLGYPQSWAVLTLNNAELSVP
jgi:hypothetical protein